MNRIGARRDFEPPTKQLIMSRLALTAELRALNKGLYYTRFGVFAAPRVVEAGARPSRRTSPLAACLPVPNDARQFLLTHIRGSQINSSRATVEATRAWRPGC